MNGEVHVESILYVSKQFRTRPLYALYYNGYIIYEKHMSAKCAEVSN